jgi:eukaryotic-like serine/threonine-protein kinase
MPDAIASDFLDLQRALAGRYSLERELGRGGMGIVFLARDVALDRPVALKLLPAGMAAQPALRARFLREAQTAAKLSHPNIVPIFAVEAVGEFVYFVMAYVEGETLGHRLQSRGPMSATEGSRLLQEVAWALAYAHLRGIVHRDVKPDNILLERDTGRALVTDFGIARRADASGTTAVGEVLGTAQYMSPEQATGEAVDGRSDLYALGVVAFYALSGRLPFDAPDVAALLAMHITRPAPPLASAAPGVPGTLAQAVDRCLVKDPAHRFQTGEALAEAVAAATAVAREVPAPIRVWLTKGQGAKVPLQIITGVAGLSLILTLAFRGSVAWGAFWWLVVPSSGFAVFRLYQTQRVLAAGYGLEDLRLALRDRLERRQEELAFEYDREPSRFGRVARWIMFAATGTAAAAAAGSLVFPAAAALVVAAEAGATTAVAALILSAAFPGERRRPKDSGLAFRVKAWNGRVGEWVARLARMGLKRGTIPPASARRPTEFIIGLAANALFDALPTETRRHLKHLPAVVRRLEADAQGLRARVDELDALIAGAGDETAAAHSTSLRRGGGPGAAGVADARERLRAELDAAREAAAQRLAASVAALENIRLDLLRLTAGAGTVDQLSADLAAAGDIAAEVDAALEGRREVEGLLGPGSDAPARAPS